MVGKQAAGESGDLVDGSGGTVTVACAPKRLCASQQATTARNGGVAARPASSNRVPRVLFSTNTVAQEQHAAVVKDDCFIEGRVRGLDTPVRI